MYQSKFVISNQILKNISLVEAAREVIENAPLVPHYEASFQKEALARTVHHGTHIEGNDLTLNEVKKSIEGKTIVARERDVQEVINYRHVINYLDELVGQKKEKEGFRYGEAMLKKINSLATERIITDSRSGQYRQTQVILKNNRTNEVVFQPPPAIEVSFLVEDFLNWFNSQTAREIHSVLRAGIAHYILVAIHPFIEANGRTARAFATLVLFVEGFDIKRFFSLEDYFDQDAASYYQALMMVDRQNQDLVQRDLTPWLDYFSRAMAVELTRIKEKVRSVSVDVKIKGKLGTQIPLNERQMRLMEYLQKHGAMTTSQARKVAPQYSDDTIVRDFNYFIKKGILKKKGRTKAARYWLK